MPCFAVCHQSQHARKERVEVEIFSINLKRMRTAAGLSKADLARMAGVSPGSIFHWERGSRTPKIEHIERIALALGVSPDKMRYEHPDDPPIDPHGHYLPADCPEELADLCRWMRESATNEQRATICRAASSFAETMGFHESRDTSSSPCLREGSRSKHGSAA
jgi:transcriptional regulator with XRE-family HTH domain